MANSLSTLRHLSLHGPYHEQRGCGDCLELLQFMDKDKTCKQY